jgi:hypothetical protein
MTQHKYQMSQAYYLAPKHNLRVTEINHDYLKETSAIKSNSRGQIGKVLQHFLKLFANEEHSKHTSANDENIILKQHSTDNDDETRTLQDLETCANAAREIGACGQYKWINRKDEI